MSIKKLEENKFTSGFLLLVSVALIGCSNTYVKEIEEARRADLREAVEKEDYVAVTRQLESALRFANGSGIAEESISYVGRQPNSAAKLSEAYQERLGAFEADPKAAKYKKIRDGVIALADGGLLSRQQSKELQDEARDAMLDAIPHMDAPSLKVTINTYDFGSQVSDAADAVYGEALLNALEDDKAWATSNIEEYIAYIERGSASDHFRAEFEGRVDSLGLSWEEKQSISVVLPTAFPDLPAISIQEIRASQPDTAGGVDASIRFVAGDAGVIKYLRFYAVPFNAVGDVVASTVDNESRRELLFTGPVDGGRPRNGLWENVWYNLSIECMEIEVAEVEFMDGRAETYAGDQLRAALSEPGMNDCSY